MEAVENPKVFGIGFHKTGTTSLQRALELLGYRVCDHFIVHHPIVRSEVKQRAVELADRHDAAQDTPWFVLYEELDAHYPDSKFVLTVRPTEDWLRSIVHDFGTDTTDRREWIYGVGCPEGNEDLYAQRYERHNREVRAYFKDRPEDLLELRITEGEGWNKLCPFLNHPIPEQPFPHALDAKERARRSMRQWIYKKSPRWLQKVEREFWEAWKSARS